MNGLHIYRIYIFLLYEGNVILREEREVTYCFQYQNVPGTLNWFLTDIHTIPVVIFKLLVTVHSTVWTEVTY
jgi:hypothetical protein